MSNELEDLIKSLPVKEPSEQLDLKIENIIKKQSVDQTDSANAVKLFPWRKVVMYGVAALLFLSIGVAELYKRAKSSIPEITEKDKSVDSDSEAVDSLTVSTSQSTGNLLKGDIIELDDGTLVRPVIRQVIIRKTYFDKEKNVEVEIKEPRNEIYYIPLKSE